MSWFSSMFSWITSLFSSSSTPQSAQVAQIQASAVKICSFLPTVESVLAVANASSPGAIVTVSIVAHQICEIVTKHSPVPQVARAEPMTLEGGGMVPPIQTWIQDGVKVEGAFVR